LVTAVCLVVKHYRKPLRSSDIDNVLCEYILLGTHLLGILIDHHNYIVATIIGFK